MKKIILTLILAVSSAMANAKQVVPVVWPFSAAASSNNFLREILEESNKLQDKYQFVFDNKPGAGGTIAVNHVLNNSSFSLLATSSAFFVRPIFFPNESYSISNFVPVYIQCTDQPLALVSTKYKNFQSLKSANRISVGAIYGTTTEVVVRELAKNLPGVTVDLIPYQGTLQPVNDVLGGQLDAAIAFIADIDQWVSNGRLNVVGLTGSTNYENKTTFISQGVSGFSRLATNYLIVVPEKTNPETVKELHAIFSKAAANSKKLKDQYSRDLCKPSNLSIKETNDQYNKWQMYWVEKLKK
jgi:tripartite-type tricarboxylate transporter receptor subunit TctC